HGASVAVPGLSSRCRRQSHPATVGDGPGGGRERKRIGFGSKCPHFPRPPASGRRSTCHRGRFLLVLQGVARISATRALGTSLRFACRETTVLTPQSCPLWHRE